MIYAMQSTNSNDKGQTLLKPFRTSGYTINEDILQAAYKYLTCGGTITPSGLTWWLQNKLPKEVAKKAATQIIKQARIKNIITQTKRGRYLNKNT